MLQFTVTWGRLSPRHPSLQRDLRIPHCAPGAAPPAPHTGRARAEPGCGGGQGAGTDGERTRRDARGHGGVSESREGCLRARGVPGGTKGCLRAGGGPRGPGGVSEGRRGD